TSIPDVPDRFVRKDGSAGAPVYDVSETDGSEEESIPLPAISVKTRLGYSKIDEWRPWLTTLLEQDLANLTVHLRTKKEMSKVPAHHELIPEIVALRDQIAPATKLTINGDIANLLQGLTLQEKYPGVDGFMIGRGVFDNPFCFTDIISPTREQLLDLFNYHLDQFDKFHELDSEIISSAHSNELVRSERSARKFGEIAVENNFILYKFEPLKRFFKIYVKDFPGAAELRVKLFECKNTSEVRDILLRAK
ncbi:tRNA-dihydrouridine synthase, partial [Candidatus Saccharibacteria bacterium]|nr:tRNA-dihydrouridine synthase [Candidatus Saccharibacteria bacterium]